MSDQLSELLQRLQNAQQTSVQRQQEVNVAVNTALGGGLEGVRQVADALDVLRAKPAEAAPYPTVPGEGALDRLLVSLAQAQVDSSNRNAHVADAVSIGVAAGAEGVEKVAAGLRALADPPPGVSTPGGAPAAPPSPDFATQLLAAVEAAKRGQALTSIGDDRLTGPGDDLGTGPGDDGGIQPQVHSAVCSTCGGSGRVLTQW